MNRSVSYFSLASFLTVLLSISSLGAPLTGSGLLPFPGATGNPPRDTYLAVGPAAGPFTGTWPGAGPNSPAATPWWGTFPVTGPKPHGPGVTGTALYNFTIGGGYIPGALPIGSYFHFGDLDAGSGPGEMFRLRAFDTAGNPIVTAWLERPFAATASSVAANMPNYNFAAGVYDFDGSFVPGNPSVSVFLKNNTAVGKLEVTRTSTLTSFIIAAPPAPEPSSLVLTLCGIFAYVARARRR